MVQAIYCVFFVVMKFFLRDDVKQLSVLSLPLDRVQSEVGDSSQLADDLSIADPFSIVGNAQGSARI
ncbi:hypothetical protein DTW90_11100 [Neorhizobium sp. P12A]|nr:hypothetical protein DTW90_11100 [Neorhizobium sp. P12A]